MGLLSKLKKLSPRTRHKKYVGLSSSKKPTPTIQPAAAASDMADPALYEGDMGDEAYGSFTDPFTVEDFYEQQDPGYAFRLQQGNQALVNAASAGSGAFSGAALKDLLAYNQDMASQEYGNAFNRYQTQQGNIFSRLFDVARLGQNAAAGVGTTGANLAGNAGQFYSNAGAASGAGIVGAGNAASSGLTNYWLMQKFAPNAAPAATGGV